MVLAPIPPCPLLSLCSCATQFWAIQVHVATMGKLLEFPVFVRRIDKPISSAEARHMEEDLDKDGDDGSD